LVISSALPFAELKLRSQACLKKVIEIGGKIPQIMLAADRWEEVFKNDPEYEFLILGVTDGFAFSLSPPDSVEYHEVPNYVPQSTLIR